MNWRVTVAFAMPPAQLKRPPLSRFVLNCVYPVSATRRARIAGRRLRARRRGTASAKRQQRRAVRRRIWNRMQELRCGSDDARRFYAERCRPCGWHVRYSAGMKRRPARARRAVAAEIAAIQRTEATAEGRAGTASRRRCRCPSTGRSIVPLRTIVRSSPRQNAHSCYFTFDICAKYLFNIQEGFRCNIGAKSLFVKRKRIDRSRRVHL